jgi:signal transduction histidine kinase
LTEQEINNLSKSLDERTIRLMERESELADQLEEIESQKEELTAAIEELVSKNKELTERNAELDQLLYRTSHDLRTPTASLTGILQLMDKEKVPAELAPYINHIKSLNSLMGRVLDALNMMRKAALDEIILENVDLADVTNQTLSELKTLPKFSWVEIKTLFQGDCRIKSDRGMIRILMMALVSNAITFRNAPDGKVKISWTQSPDEIQLMVEDDGEGINQKYATRIFDMFYRGSANSIGTGMGLYSLKRIVDRLHGKIEWSSQSGLTIFKIAFPIL